MSYTYKNMPCGTPQSSDCVLYVGEPLKTIDVDQTCLKSTTEIIQELDNAIDTINKAIDISKLKTHLSIDVKKASLNDYLQAIDNSVRSVKESLSALNKQGSIDILSTPINIDLTALGSSCADTSSTTLLTVLSAILQKITQLDNKNAVTQSSITAIYQPS